MLFSLYCVSVWMYRSSNSKLQKLTNFPSFSAQNEAGQYPSTIINTTMTSPSPNDQTCACTFWECGVCVGDGVCCTPGSMESLCCHEKYPKCCPPMVVGTQCCEEDDVCCPLPTMGKLGCCEEGETCCNSPDLGELGCCGLNEPLCCHGKCCELDKVY